MKPSELIYRVWDKNEKHYVNNTPWDENGHLKNNLQCGIYGIDDKSAEIEISTGLKDSNGNVIFDGDILKETHFGKSHTYQVSFENGEFVVNENGKIRNLCSVLEVRQRLEGLSVEISGNVHEKELEEKILAEQLKEQKNAETKNV